MGVNHDWLVDAGMALRAMAPQEWDVFIHAVSDHASQVGAEMLRAPPEHLQRAQGMAIQAHDFASTLANLPKMHENRQMKTMGKRHG